VVTICNERLALKKKLVRISSPLIAFIVTAIPYVIYLHRQVGAWTISGKSAITIIGVDASARLLPDGRTVGDSLGAKKIGIMNLFANLTDLTNNYVRNLSKFSKIVPEYFPILVLLVALLGLGLSLRSVLTKDDGSRLLRTAQTLVFMSGVAAIIPVFAFSNLSIAASYILPIFPLIMICFSMGAISIEQWALKICGVASLPAGDRLKRWTPATATVIAILCYLSFAPFWSQLESEGFRDFAASQEFFLKDTGLWLKNNTPENSFVMSRWSNISFYADRKWSYLADGKVNEVVDYAKKHEVNYIVIDTNAVPRRRPELAPLLNPFAPHNGLRPVYAQEQYGIGVIIYLVL
jgi:succinate dehydrogenase hydrophobic anchor subunit